MRTSCSFVGWPCTWRSIVATPPTRAMIVLYSQSSRTWYAELSAAWMGSAMP